MLLFPLNGMVWYTSYIAHLLQMSLICIALCTLVPRKQPSVQALFEGAIVLQFAEVVGQRVPNHRAVHSECRRPTAESCCVAGCLPTTSVASVQQSTRFRGKTAGPLYHSSGPAASYIDCLTPVSYTHLTLPTKRIV